MLPSDSISVEKHQKLAETGFVLGIKLKKKPVHLVSLLGDLEQLVQFQHPAAYTIGHKAEQRKEKEWQTF